MWPLKFYKVKFMPISITNKWLMGIKLSFSYFSVFIETNPLTLTSEKKLGWLSDTEKIYL